MSEIHKWRFLFVGDHADDASKVENAIQDVFRAHPQQYPFTFRWVTDMPAAALALIEHQFHLIIYGLESTDAVALSHVEDVVAEAHHIPVIVLVNEMEKYLNMDLLDRGAQSYLIRSDLSVERVYMTFCSVIAGLT